MALAQIAVTLMFIKIVSDSSVDVLEALAYNIHCDPEVLTQLIKENLSYEIRRNAVFNKNISNEMLKFLLSDRNSHIRREAKEEMEKRGITA
ncbi:MAG: hypothetical protein IPK77_00005 [Cellvibrio sp.]|nr:hypothetical protein [Cellvibrio sp.]